MTGMQKEDFQFLSALLKQRSGLDLNEEKAYLIESRLLPVARALQLEDISQLCVHLRGLPGEAVLVEIT